MSKKIIIVLLSVAAFLPFAAQAREDRFVSAVGEISSAVAGMERAVATAEGGLGAYSAQGKLLSGFPVFVDNQVFVTSPLLANIMGDEQNEILAVGRNGDRYTLFAFDNAGTRLGSVAVNGGEIYYDAVALPRPSGDYDDIVLADISGQILRYRFSDGVFTESQAINVGFTVGLAVNADKNNLILNFPERDGVKVYEWSGDNLVLQRSIAVAQRFIYPVKDGGNGFWYGVNRDGALVGFNSQTGSIASGFPVNNAAMPIGGPEIVQYDADNNSTQVAVPLSNGQSAVVTDKGEIVAMVQEKRSLLSANLPGVDETGSGLISGVRDYGVRVVKKLKDYSLSLWSRIGIIIPIGHPEIEIKINGDSIVSGGSYDLGTYEVGEQINFKLRIENKGNGNLSLNGAVPVELSGAGAGGCQVSLQPANTVLMRSFKEAGLTCQYDSVSEPTIDVRVANNDQDENPYLVNLKIKIIVNKVQDGNMELAGMEKWLKYGSSSIFEKSTTVFKNGLRSLHFGTPGTNAGIQQRFIAVEAGKIYRLSLNYRLTNGQLKVRLGANSSNADFENKMVVLSDVGQWNSYTREFKVPANFVGDWRFVASTVGGEAYLDNVRIEEIAKFTPVADGDMEYPTTARWVAYGVSTVFEKNNIVYRNGRRSIRVAAVGGGFQQRFLAVEKGKNYRLTFNYRINRGQLVNRLGVNDSNGDFEGKAATLTKIGSWESYIREFKVPDNFVGDFRIVFVAKNGESYIDDVKIEEIVLIANLVTDGNMELAGVGAWTDWGTVLLKEKYSQDRHAGGYSLHLRTGAAGDTLLLGGIQQIGVSGLAPGQIYVFSFWYKHVQGRMVPRLGIGSSNNDFELAGGQGRIPIIDAPSASWQYYERSFIVPADFAGDFRMVFALYDMRLNPDGQSFTHLDYAETYLDDVEIRLADI